MLMREIWAKEKEETMQVRFRMLRIELMLVKRTLKVGKE